MQKRSLGRGLSDLLAGGGAVSTRAVIEVEPERIDPNPYQPRRVFTEEDLADLASSIRQQGVLQPILVREVNERYQLIAGERRWRAAKMVGLPTIPCLVHNLDDLRTLLLALIENLQREDLDAVEQARAYRQMMDEFGMTQEEVADHLGKSRSAVANCVRLLTLPVEVQEAVSSGALSEGHARALLAVRDDPGRLYEICQTVLKEGLNVRQTEELARKGPEAPRVSSPARPIGEYDYDPLTDHAIEKLQQALATKVHLNRNANGGGSIVIKFHSDEDLVRLLAAIITPDGF